MLAMETGNNEISLPSDVFAEILDYIPKPELVHNVSLVCSNWRIATKNPILWPRLDKTIWKYPFPKKFFPSMKRFLHFLSRPQFSRINILESPNVYIRRTMNRDNFDKIAKACPLIEEIHLYNALDVYDELERLPGLFPKLKAVELFTLPVHSTSDIVAFTRLMGNRLVEFYVHIDCKELPHTFTDDTLMRIAKACPNLEKFRYCVCAAGWFPNISLVTTHGVMKFVTSCTKLNEIDLDLGFSVALDVFQLVEGTKYDFVAKGLSYMKDDPDIPE